MDAIIRDSIIMLVSLFTIIILYLFLSTPFDTMMTNIDTAANEPHTSYTISLIKTVFNIFFAMLALTPIIWFILRVMRREPQWGYY